MGNYFKRVRNLVHEVLFEGGRRTRIKIFFYTAYIRAKVLLIPMKYLEKSFGERGAETDTCIDRVDHNEAVWTSIMVNSICDYTLWNSNCMVRALTAQHILKKKHIPTTLYLGLREDDGRMSAHAWLRCGIFLVTGNDGKNYTVVAKFKA